jgi:3-keto-5-aminohexanoate cleavage enzyme
MLEYYRDRGMIPTLAAFEPGHIRAVAGFMREGMFHGAPILKFFFSDLWLHGVLADRHGLEAYLHMLEASDLLDQVEWMCVPYAVTSPDREHALLNLAIERGGHVRVGVGDNPLTSNGRSNAELVAEIAGRARAASRSVATPGDVIAMTAPRS